MRAAASSTTSLCRATHISRHINILHSALYREDKKHVCSSAYQMLSPSLFVCQLNATSVSTENPSASRRHTARLSYPKPSKPTFEREIQPSSGSPALFRFSYAFLLRASWISSLILPPLFFLSPRPSFYIPHNLFSRLILRRASQPAGSPPFWSYRDNGGGFALGEFKRRRHIIFLCHSARSALPCAPFFSPYRNK